MRKNICDLHAWVGEGECPHCKQQAAPMVAAHKKPQPFVGYMYMRADGCSWGGYSVCREGDEGAFPVKAA